MEAIPPDAVGRPARRHTSHDAAQPTHAAASAPRGRRSKFRFFNSVAICGLREECVLLASLLFAGVSWRRVGADDEPRKLPVFIAIET